LDVDFQDEIGTPLQSGESFSHQAFRILELFFRNPIPTSPFTSSEKPVLIKIIGFAVDDAPGPDQSRIVNPLGAGLNFGRILRHCRNETDRSLRI